MSKTKKESEPELRRKPEKVDLSSLSGPCQIVRGWSAFPLFKDQSIFTPQVIRLMPSQLAPTNRDEVCFCSNMMHAYCEKNKICQLIKPDCTWRELTFVGKKFSQNLTSADRAKIRRELRATLKRCREVTVIVTEGS